MIVISTADATGQNGSIRIYDVRDLMEAELAKLKARWASWVKEHGHQRPTTNALGMLGGGEPTWDELAELITKSVIIDHVAVDTWKDNGGAIGSIRELNGRLIIRQTWQNHQKVEAILDELREKGLPATQSSRPASAQPEGEPL